MRRREKRKEKKTLRNARNKNVKVDKKTRDYTGLVKIMLTLMDYNNHLFPAKCASGL